MQRQGELDHAQVRAQVTAGLGDGLYNLLPNLGRQALELVEPESLKSFGDSILSKSRGTVSPRFRPAARSISSSGACISFPFRGPAKRGHIKERLARLKRPSLGNLPGRGE